MWLRNTLWWFEKPQDITELHFSLTLPTLENSANEL